MEENDIKIKNGMLQELGSAPVIVVDIFSLDDRKIAEQNVVQVDIPVSKSAIGNALTSFHLTP